MLQLSQLKHVALAILLGTIALIGSAEYVFAQDVPYAVVAPTAAAPDPAVIPPASGTQAVILENGNTATSIVLPEAGAASVALPGASASVRGYDSPLDNVVTPYSPVSTILPYAMSPSGSDNVLTSDDPPLDNVYGPGAAFPNNPWKG
jgi:hypothetical protein